MAHAPFRLPSDGTVRVDSLIEDGERHDGLLWIERSRDLEDVIDTLERRLVNPPRLT